MDITKYPYQTVLNYFVATRRSLIRFCLSLIFTSGLLTAWPAMSAPILEFDQVNFTGVFGVDYPVLDFVVDIDDGDAGIADYFFEWTLFSRDSSGSIVNTFTNSVFGDYISLSLDSVYGYSLFPTAGDYTLTLSMLTFHQVGGLSGCGPNSGCWDNTKSFDERFTSDIMNVQLSSVPVPAAVWLFGSGLIGLIGVARKKKS